MVLSLAVFFSIISTMKLVHRRSHHVDASCRTSAAVMDLKGFCHRKIGVVGLGRTPRGLPDRLITDVGGMVSV